MFFPGSEFPFAYENQTDPFTGKNDGILARCTASKTCPKIVHLNSGTEFWQAGQSLVTTDPLGQRDSTPPDNVRIWSMTSIAHQGVNPAMPKGVCAMPYNPDRLPSADARGAGFARPLGQGRHARAGQPLSAHRGRNAGAVGQAQCRHSRARHGEGRQSEAAPRLRPGHRQGHHRQGAAGRAQGINTACWCRASTPTATRRRASRLPDITVPTGTAMGWSVRSEAGGGTGELCYLDGAFIPFAKTKAEREASERPAALAGGALSRQRRLCRAREGGRRLRSNATAICCRRT